MTTRRLYTGDRGHGPGLHLALPGYDAATDDVQDASKFSFSTDWAFPLKFPAWGTTPCNTWVTIPNDPGFMPIVFFRKYNGGNDVGGFIKGVSGVSQTRYTYSSFDYRIEYQIVGGVRQFRIVNLVIVGITITSASQNFWYLITNLGIDG